MAEGRPPLWILVLGTACLSFLIFAAFLHVAGPEPVGWTLQRSGDRRAEAGLVIASVEPGSAAARAGLQSGDLLREPDLRNFMYQEEAGGQYRFEVERKGGGRDTVSIVLNRPSLAYWLSARAAGPIFATLLSALYLLLAGVIVFSRPRDTIARWGALVLAAMAAFILWYGVGRPTGMAAGIRGLPIAAGVLLLIAPAVASLGPSLIVTFLAGFPRSGISSRGLAILFWVGSLPGSPVLAYGVWAPVYSPESVFSLPPWFGPPMMIAVTVYCSAGAGLLARNYVKVKDPNERRRVRVVVLGFIISMAAFVAQFVTVVARGSAAQVGLFPMSTPLHWLFAPFMAAAPACMAYAILRHRMFDIRIMIRQGIQYGAARGVLLSAVPLLAVLLAVDLLLHGDRPLVETLGQRAWLYLFFAAAAFLLHARRNTWLMALDRRFFRERYDAQRVLREVVEEVRASHDFEKAARRVVSQIEATLHPEMAAVLARRPGEAAFDVLACALAPPPAIPADSKIIGLVRLLAKPVEIPQSDTGWVRQQLPREESEFLKRAHLEWLFPISIGAEDTEAILALGRKRSEEPYSREDQDLIMTVASSLALLLERSPVSASHGAGFEECPQCGACYDSGAGRCVNEDAKLTPLPFPRLLAHRYRFEKRLGRGGMGTVYEALDTELERRVAVKLIRPELLASPEASARFKREAKAAAGLSHPNVVTVFDFGVGEDQRAYLVMELLRGRTLRLELQQRGRLTAERAGKIVQGVCAAVAAAHERRVVHRDLKPENIFLTEAAGAEVAKVLDFGLAKPVALNEETVTLADTAPGVLVGTVKYMSPEQLRGGPPDESWDLWALAVLVYEMLTGGYPFPPAAAADWRHAIMAGRILSARTHVREAPENWDVFFSLVLAADVHQRPSSAARFAAAFQELVSQS